MGCHLDRDFSFVLTLKSPNHIICDSYPPTQYTGIPMLDVPNYMYISFSFFFLLQKKNGINLRKK